MDKSCRRELKRQAKAQLMDNDYALNKGGIPRFGQLIGLPETASDSDYLKAVIAHAATVLFPLEDAPKMELHDRGPEGDSILHVACSLGDLRAVRLLVEAGVEIDDRDEMNETPLHCAVSGRYLDIVEFLLYHGASPDIKGAFGYSPLEWAIQMGFDDVVAAIRHRK